MGCGLTGLMGFGFQTNPLGLTGSGSYPNPSTESSSGSSCRCCPCRRAGRRHPPWPWPGVAGGKRRTGVSYRERRERKGEKDFTEKGEKKKKKKKKKKKRRRRNRGGARRRRAANGDSTAAWGASLPAVWPRRGSDTLPTA